MKCPSGLISKSRTRRFRTSSTVSRADSRFWTSDAAQACTERSSKRVHGHRVVGVDLSEQSIAKAKTRLAEAYVADVTKPELYPFFGSRRFDVIVFSDILEHFYDPAQVLTSHYQLVAPGGHVLISLPNIAIWNVRLSVLAGRFEYQDTGTLDRTHIRFFTRATFRQFTREYGPGDLNAAASHPEFCGPLSL